MLKGFLDGPWPSAANGVVEHIPENNPMQWFPALRPTHPSTGPAQRWRLGHVEPRREGRRWMGRRQRHVPPECSHREISFRATSYSEDKIWVDDALRPDTLWPTTPPPGSTTATMRTRTSCTAEPSRAIISAIAPSATCPRWDLKQSPTQLLRQFKWTFLKSGLNPVKATKWWRFYSQRRAALIRGTDAFLDTLEQGEEALDSLGELCGKPPIPAKRS